MFLNVRVAWHVYLGKEHFLEDHTFLREGLHNKYVESKELSEGVQYANIWICKLREDSAGAMWKKINGTRCAY